MIDKKLGYKYHWSVSDYLQRSARHISSQTDVEQAIAVGRAAAKLALNNANGVMPVIKRINNHGEPYAWVIEESELIHIANKEKIVPTDFISEDGFRISQKGVDYLKPLTVGENYPKYQDGVPIYEQLDLHLAEI